jgi:hypothetical protein
LSPRTTVSRAGELGVRIDRSERSIAIGVLLGVAKVMVSLPDEVLARIR